MAQNENILDVQKWMSTRARATDPVPVTQPKQLTIWTKTSKRDGGRFLFGDASGLLTFSQPKLPDDLNAGYPDKYISKDDGEASPVDTIVQAASQVGVDWKTINVCTYRNNLNKILLTPLNSKDGWTIDACRMGPTLFLDIVKAGADTNTWPGQDKMCYYGYKFEALCTGDSDEVDATSEFATVVRYKLGRHRIIMAAEIDAQAPAAAAEGAAAGSQKAQQQQQQQKQPQYVELKCYKIPGHPRAEATIYSQKHPRWWVQSFLAGVQQLALGGRDDRGTLLRVHTVPVQQLPELSARANQPWDANMLLRFGDECLAWMCERAAREGEGVQLRFDFDPGRKVVMSSVLQGGSMAERLGGLLPEGAVADAAAAGARAAAGAEAARAGVAADGERLEAGQT